MFSCPGTKQGSQREQTTEQTTFHISDIFCQIFESGTEGTLTVMQVEVIRAILQFGQFDSIDHLLLNVTTCTGCGQYFQCEKIKEETLIVTIELT